MLELMYSLFFAGALFAAVSGFVGLINGNAEDEGDEWMAFACAIGGAGLSLFWIFKIFS